VGTTADNPRRGAPDGAGGSSVRPLRVMFVTTRMTIGGQEMLLADLIRGLDRARFAPHLCCLKYPGPLGERLADEVPTVAGLLAHKRDVRVWWRLARVLRARQIDIVVTVGSGGDRMFWGRLAAWSAGVPVIVAALHATGRPPIDVPNRLLAPLTDAFIATSDAHARYVIDVEGCPAHKVRIIANGVDTARFRPSPGASAMRTMLGLPPTAPVVGMVARLRPEKNHARFLRVAARVRQAVPDARFVLVGDGEGLAQLRELARQLGIADAVHFCGARLDVAALLAGMDVFLLTSDVETSPVSILEAMASGKPVVATRVGSVPALVRPGITGFLVAPDDEAAMAGYVTQLLGDADLALRMGGAGREQVMADGSLERMVAAYESLLRELYDRQCPPQRAAASRSRGGA
jgi:glycosyltransferase involved in cell wall biosynthesis